ncbi:alanine racemase [uncultured Maribacter sp.]|uniref:alanine racemase n=1 Tax=uncultured Maribacter sp. TaxID=431308 RepID=UPI00260E822A|nr:alanine racemase [uncultured Maribacter sp.]
MTKTKETVLEISLAALEYNYHFLKAKLNPKTKFLGVVKAFAYGSDACKIAKKLSGLGIDYLAVAYTKEGVELRNAGITTPILVLHPQASNFKTIIDNHLEPSLYSISILTEFQKVLKEKKIQEYPIHIKFNTGLNRLGFSDSVISVLLAKINACSSLKIKSVFSHLAASDDLEDEEFTNKQIKAFLSIKTKVDSEIDYQPMYHLLNTSGILNYPEAQFNMVRSGIGLYGYSNSSAIDKKLKPVATLKTIISQKHTLRKGESLGYNRAFIATNETITATLPIGHADGIGRQYGQGRSFVLVNGKKAPIIGNVCMDMIMIDVTKIDCNEGDEVLIFGLDSSAEEFANTANTISYELLTGISSRVKREIKP